VTKNIALVGFMGTGKSTVGPMLAERLGMEYLEMDAMIEEEAGRSIPDMFAESEIIFREYEMRVCKRVASMENAIISCGGGVILNKLNLDYLAESSDIVCLTAPASVIFERTQNSTRPLLAKPNPLNEIRKLLKYRMPLYDRSTDIQINTYNKTLEQIAQEVIDRIQNNNTRIPGTPHNNDLTDLISMMQDTISSVGVKGKCAICGGKLVMLESPTTMTCSGCEKSFETLVKCEIDHFVCDSCSSLGSISIIESLCSKSTSNNPIQIFKEVEASELFKSTDIAYAALVAGALVTAASNIIPEFAEQRKIHIVLAIRRVTSISAIYDIVYGAHPAAFGVGSAVSVLLKPTRKAIKELQNTTIAFEKAQAAIIEENSQDPRKNAIIALNEGKKQIEELMGIKLE